MDSLEMDFENLISALPPKNLDNLCILTNFVSPEIFWYIKDATTYKQAMGISKFVHETYE